MTAMPQTDRYKRARNDAYFTPEWCVRVLLRIVQFRGAIWEPAAGDGAIVRALEEAGYRVVLVTDIAGGAYGLETCARVDFLRHGSPGDGPFSIVTNPPYTRADRFIRHALHLTARAGGMVAMLLRVDFDSAITRQDLFGDAPFARKIVLTRRPKWRSPGGPFGEGSPRYNFAWFVWDWRHAGPAVLSYGQ